MLTSSAELPRARARLVRTSDPPALTELERDAGNPQLKPDVPHCTGSEVVRSQAYLDAVFKGCTTISDSLYIDANTVDNLDALAEVESIASRSAHTSRR